MKKIFKSLAICLVIVAMFSTTAFAAAPNDLAVPQANSYIWKTTVGIAPLGNGVIDIDFSITATGKMPDVGATRVTIYKEGGTIVATYIYTDPGYGYMMDHNSAKHTASVTYQGVSGQRYYAIVTFYAGNLNGSGGGAALRSPAIYA